MRNILFNISLSAITSCLALSAAMAQKMPERSLIRKGNRTYDRGDYVSAEARYRNAIGKDSTSFAAHFNLGDALYRQGRFEEATAISGGLAQLPGASREDLAKSFYNTGNALLQQRKLEEAIEAYKNSLRLDPSDQEAKFNLAYAKKLLEKDQNNDKQDQQDKNDKQNQGGGGDQNQDQKDQNQSQGGGGDQDKQDQQNQQGQQPRSGNMSKEEAERMLQAIQGNEDETRKKVDESKAKAMPKSNKNW